MSNKKIILCASDSWYLLNFRYDLIKELNEKYSEVVIVTSFDGSEKKMGEFFPNIRIINSLLDRKSTGLMKNVFLIYCYFKIYINEKPDFVMNFTIKPNVFSAFVCIVLSIPFINNVTGLGTVFIKGGALQNIVIYLYRVIFPFAKNIIFQNNDDMSLIKDFKVSARNFVLIEGSGVNTNVFSSNESILEREYDFVFIGRIIKDKGVVEYIKAMKRLKLEYPSLRVLIVGGLDSDNQTSLSKEEFNELIEDSGIEYLGKRSDVPKILSETKFMVLPSYREGLSKVLIEAASMGCVILTSDVPGCRQVVESNGFLFEPKNVESLYNTVLNTIEIGDEELLRLSKNSRKLAVSRFSTEIVNKKIFNLLQD
ncbi:glycosyl transferase [Halobacteriovorax sp. BALOs_7]|uniref:Glycosyltransferase family 1 protein n=1 Tax=Halobacteriovorax vibrionivorans TaxID=2152716 RepID=A0ABY0IJH6_9BACT|nr:MULTISPECIES: glycosyltransferase family 4 protein [Halobacteriovorax]AYF43053.1 glycosyl transferase [Halobacteriovorax sp. BALOs_7]RZF23078.1 glycosyltransferase family 1 protein [Halobacteriovorax vibrionivorans]TGD49290.1 glycosyltransferase family 1 protein [Halobacteriovorax sp. Y22]